MVSTYIGKEYFFLSVTRFNIESEIMTVVFFATLKKKIFLSYIGGDHLY